MGRNGSRTIKIKTLIISVVAVFGVEAALKIGMATTPFDRMLLLGLARLLQTRALVMVVVTLEGGLAAIGLERHTLYPGLKKGLIWSAGVGIVVLLAFVLLFLAGVDVRPLIHTRLPESRGQIALFFLVGGLAAPIAEELFFRGIIYGFFRRWGVIVALVLSTGAFLLAHSLKGGFPITQLAGGILFAVAYEVEGSLMAPIVIHVLGNLSIFTFSLVF